ncbi:MAG: FAD-dependent oxidoreductase [Burkholderiales bacterium]
MNPSADVVVLGAGPAGAAAAVEAASSGLSVVVVDEQAQAGGQVYRIAAGISPTRSDGERADGDRLRDALASANVDRRFEHRAWHVERTDDRWRVHALGPDGPRTFVAAALIVATGALERHVPFAGWERPGVMGLAAATVLLKAQRVLPGRSVVVAGAGPLLLVVAKAIVDGGGSVAAVVDAHPRGAWLADAADLALRPDLVARGVGWVRTLRAHGVRMLYGHRLQAVAGDAPQLRATVVAVDRSGRARAHGVAIEIACDAVCCGYGLMPATDVTRLAGAAHAFDPARGGWHAVVDDAQRCNVPGLYVAGDGAGIVGAAAAPWQGRIAAMAAARDLGRLDARTHAERSAAARRASDRAARFGRAMTRIAQIGDGAIADIAPDVTMCQCERLTRRTLASAIADGCATINDLKAATRCGMGPCGGRLCEDAVARLITLATGRPRPLVGQGTGRPPLRPVDLDALAGDFDYDALPMATPAPL